jgi:hypothetical protein
MIDAGASHQQLANRRLLLVSRQRGRTIIDAELRHGLVEVDLTALDRDAEQRAEQALADRVKIDLARDVARRRHHHIAVNDHERGGVISIGVVLDRAGNRHGLRGRAWIRTRVEKTPGNPGLGARGAEPGRHCGD